MSWRPSWWLDLLKTCWPIYRWGVKATRLPIIGRLITFVSRPYFSEKNFNISYIPIQAKIESPVNTVLTEKIIGELVQRSAHRVIIKRCTCRDSKGCENFPIEDSCLMLGEDTQRISPEIGSHVSIDEALTHMREKIALGLIPMTGRVRLDDFYYGVPNRGKMLTICFCCPCCCSVLQSVKYFPQEFRKSIVPLQGIKISIENSKCVLCGACIEACFLEAISIQQGLIEHDLSRCISCGRCSTVCPQGATQVEVEDCDLVVNELLSRISERVNIE